MSRTIIGLLLATLLVFLISSPVALSTKADAISSAGQVQETIGNDTMLMHVKEVQVSSNSGQKVVSIAVVFKNLDFKPQLFNLFYMELKDTDGREYSPELFESNTASAYIPTKDTATAVLIFKIPSSTNPKTFAYSELFSSPLTIDLTRTKNPPDQPPKSEWILSGNKGFTAKDSKVELIINDESWLGKYYILDITIRNIGKESLAYNPFYTNLKDDQGIVYSHSIFVDLDTPLSSGELAPGDFVRGQVAFELDSPSISSSPMFIWSGNLGFGSYFNTGVLSTAKSTDTTQPAKSDAGEQWDYKAKLSLSASITEKTKNLSVSLKNPKNSDAKVYELHLVFSDNASVKSAIAPNGWAKEINGDSVTFSTSTKPLEAGKSLKLRLTLDKVAKTIEWDALDDENNIINSKLTTITIRK